MGTAYSGEEFEKEIELYYSFIDEMYGKYYEESGGIHMTRIWASLHNFAGRNDLTEADQLEILRLIAKDLCGEPKE
jgi:hypothetical protein